MCFSSAIILSVTPSSQILVTDVADIDSVSKPGQANGDITLKLKDFRILHLKISPASLCQEVVASIVELSKLGMLSAFRDGILCTLVGLAAKCMSESVNL